MRQKIVIANWKEYITTQQEVESFCNDFKESLVSLTTKEIVILPPYLFIPYCKEFFKDSSIKTGAQNLFYEDSGAFTGEISGLMLKSYVQYVLIGHSERRKNFAENDEIINKKIKNAFKNGISPVLCVGESEEAYQNKSLDMILEQVENGLNGVNQSEVENLVIAYEPIWAIGTQNSAAAEYVNNICGRIRVLLSTLYSRDIANKIRILYGGSVTKENAGNFSNQPEIDGLLVGEASVKVKSLLEIIKSFK